VETFPGWQKTLASVGVALGRFTEQGVIRALARGLSDYPHAATDQSYVPSAGEIEFGSLPDQQSVGETSRATDDRGAIPRLRSPSRKSPR